MLIFLFEHDLSRKPVSTFRDHALESQHAAIDRDDRSGHVVRQIGRQEFDHARAILHRALPPQGDAEGAAASPATAATGGAPDWRALLGREARRRLQAGDTDVWQRLSEQFEAQLLRTALTVAGGRPAEAAHQLGIGRNTITRKIQELGLDD